MISQPSGIDDQIDKVQDELKAIIQNLYNLIVQALDHQGSPTQEAMKREIQSLVANLITLSRNARHVPIDIPPEIIRYVENSRNPTIFNREFIELVQRMNQMLKGRCEAFAQMQAILAKDIITAIPELEEDVRKVVRSTHGRVQE
jgi:mediator of RNA polymerase II transcription subunit 10